MSRQDNFSFLHIFDDMCVLKLVLSERLIFLLFLQYDGGSFPLNIVFLLVGFSLFPCICKRCFVCFCFFITHVSCSVYFERAGSLGVFLAGRVILSSVWGSAVWSVGPVQFI